MKNLALSVALLLSILLAGCQSVSKGPVHFEVDRQVAPGQGVYVLGDHPLLGGGDPTRAVRLVEATPGHWTLDAVLPPGTKTEYRYLVRDDGNLRVPDPTNAEFLDPVAHALRVSGRGARRDASPGLFDPALSAPRVEKIPAPPGRLSPRSIYVYLPRGYDQEKDAKYPIILMHDGQNCFEQFVQDSFVGSWKADLVATRLIDEGRMKKCVIVGVANGGANRIREYMPPWATYRDIRGEGDKTMAYYFDDLLPWLRANYRIADGRENVATVGSSLGGLMALYAAFEWTDRAKNHGALSSALQVTRPDGGAAPEIFAKYGAMPKPDVRLWLDSGTLDAPNSTTPEDDDGMRYTTRMRDVLIGMGFVYGDDLMHMTDPGGYHNEGPWSARLDRVFEYLFPADAR